MCNFSNHLYDPSLQQGYPTGVSNPSELSQALCLLDQNQKIILDLIVERERIQNQLGQKHLREMAYANFYSNDGHTYTVGKNGSPQLLMDTTVLESYLLSSEPPLRNDLFYQINLDRYGLLIIRETDFFSDSRLINVFQQHGVQVFILRSQKNTANLLRQAINRNIRVCSLMYYGGWRPEDNEAIHYYLFQDFSTCLTKGGITLNQVPTQSQAVISTAVAQFWPVFKILRTSFLRDMLILLYHEAALHTLLRELGYKFPLACCFFSTENRVLEYFRNLLSWFKCPKIKLDASNKDFTYALLCRKDQPLLIEDLGKLSHAAKNVDLLISAITNDAVAWKRGRDAPQSLPIQAPVTLLSSCPSALNCSTDSMVLDFSIEDFNVEAWLDCADQVGQNQDYLTAFCGYASQHIPELQNALDEGKKAARYCDGGKLSGKYLQAYGILMGIRSFLENFFAYAMPESPAFSLSNEELSGQMLNLLVQTMEKADRGSLPNLFIEIAKDFIQKRVLPTHHVERCPKDMTKVVFYDDDHLHFTSKAFFTVCHSMTQSRPVIETALSEASLFCGTPVNGTTFETRISVWNAYGKRETAYVFSFERELFETYGDPLPLDTEELS